MKESINKVLKGLGWIFLLILVVLLILDFLKRGIFENKTGLNLLVVGDKNIGVMIIRPDDGVVSWISLPDSLKIKIHNSSASYPIGSVWSFGESEKKPYLITENSVGSALGIVIPRLVKVEGEASLESLLGQFLSLGLRTDLSLRDRWLVRNIVSEASISKRIIELDIPASAFDKIVEADGKEFFVLNKVINVWAKDKFYHDDILEEAAEVRINNISSVQGAGNSLSRMLDSAGFRVIDVVNDEKDTIKEGGCRFVVSQKYPMSTKFLEDHVGCKKLASTEGKETSDYLLKIWLK